jgi:hypothetical protein
MEKVVKEYANANNGGREKFSRCGQTYTVNSYVPGMGWLGEQKISKEQAKMALSYTKAPQDVVSAILV